MTQDARISSLEGRIAAASDPNAPASKGVWRHIAEDANQLSAMQSAQSTKAYVLSLSGSAWFRAYEVGHDIESLGYAVETLRDAYSAYHPNVPDALKHQFATALVRSGEQRGRLSELRESLEVFSELADLDTAMINAKAVAELRIGVLTGDMNLVERAVQDLRRHIGSEGLKPDEKTMTLTNLSVALLENARQNKSVRVYRSLLKALAKRELKTRSDAQLTHARASALLELSQLNGKAPLAEQARDEFERIAAFLESVSGDVCSALHSVAQSEFALGKTKKSGASMLRAVSAIDRALRAMGPQISDADTRRYRLIADRGAYHLAAYRLTGQKEHLTLAKDDYTSARSQIDVRQAPLTFEQISRGLFELHYGEREWDAAISVFVSMDAARVLIETDPALSSGVEDFGPRLRAEFSDRYVRCLIETDNLVGAAIAMETSRARRLSRALEQSSLQLDDLDERARSRLKLARSALEQSLQSGDDAACHHAASDLRTLRRELGLAKATSSHFANPFQDCAPEGGAVVQLSFSHYGSCALIWLSGDTAPHRFDLPGNAHSEIAKVFFGDEERLSWLAGYDWFKQSELSPTPGGSGRGSDAHSMWNATIAWMFDILGKAIAQPLDRELRRLGLAEGAEICICPPGDLSALPLCNAPLSETIRFNEVWSASLIPNLRTLARQKLRWDRHQILCVTDPNSFDGRSPILPAAKAEAARLQKRFQSSTLLEGFAATHQNVLATLSTSSVAHFACHSVYDAMQPDDSGFLLANNKRLTLTRLRAAGETPRRFRLAFLSSCESGMTGRTVDFNEFVGLPSALLALGAQTVIATQWAIYDDAAFVMADRFYDEWLSDDGREKTTPASALARAQAWVRQATLADLKAEGLWLEGVFDTARPRLRRLGEQEQPKSPVPVVQDDQFRPFHAPHDWAGFTVIGR